MCIAGKAAKMGVAAQVAKSGGAAGQVADKAVAPVAFAQNARDKLVKGVAGPKMLRKSILTG